MVSSASRISAFFAYLIPVFSWAYVYAARRDDRLAMFHTRQSITVFVVAILAFAFWAIVGWFLSLIPYMGFIIMVAFFAIVMLVLFAMFVNWIMGMVYALQAKLKPLPVTGTLAEGIPGRQAAEYRRMYRQMEKEADAVSGAEQDFTQQEVTITVIGFGWRFIAVVIDVIFIAFITFLIGVGFSLLDWFISVFKLSEGTFHFGTLFVILSLLVSVVYYVGFWSKSGQTMGKSMMGIKVIGADGKPLSTGQSLLRYGGYIVSGLFFSLGFLWVFLDKRSQGWHDKIAKTYVVDEDSAFLNAKSIEFENLELGQNWIWLSLWLILAIFGPVGAVSGLWVLGPIINNSIVGLFGG